MSARDNKPHCNTRATCDTALAQAVTKIAYDLVKAEAAYRLAKVRYFASDCDDLAAQSYHQADAKRDTLRDIATNLLRICAPLPRRQRRPIWQAAQAGFRTARIILLTKGGGL